MESEGGALETGFYAQTINNALNGIVFGHLLLKDETRRTDSDYKCEAVLIGPKHVLSIYPECVPTAYDSFPYDSSLGRPKIRDDGGDGEIADGGDGEIVYQYSKNKGVSKFSKAVVKVESMWRTKNSLYVVSLLADLQDLEEEKFPILSWTKQDAIENYGLYLEMAEKYPVLLSTPTATQDLNAKFVNPHLKKFLANSEFEEDLNHITLKTPGLAPPTGDFDASVKVGGTARPLNGAAFFKPTGGTVALFGLNSATMVLNCETRTYFATAGLKQEKRKPGGKDEEKNGCQRHFLSWKSHGLERRRETGSAAGNGLPRDHKVIPQKAAGIRVQLSVFSAIDIHQCTDPS